MSKRTLYSPYVVESQREDGSWRIHSYENSPRMARRAARNFVQYHNSPARVSGNPHNEFGGLGVVFTTQPSQEGTSS